jgi:hypothetical protein
VVAGIDAGAGGGDEYRVGGVRAYASPGYAAAAADHAAFAYTAALGYTNMHADVDVYIDAYATIRSLLPFVAC